MKMLTIFLITSLLVSLSHEHETSGSTILFSTLGRSTYNFDIYTLPIPFSSKVPRKELRLTDGTSVNYNGHFPSESSLVYVTERNGSSSIYLDTFSDQVIQEYVNNHDNSGKRSMLQTQGKSQVRLIGGQVSMKDRPSLVGDYLVYVSTHEETKEPRSSWTAVYSTKLSSMSTRGDQKDLLDENDVTVTTRRLTPKGIADFSPAMSPSGEWTAVASLGERGWAGEVQELNTDIYVFRTEDGSGRVRIAEHGGWPSWADESTLYFHRRGEDGWWSVYKAILPNSNHLILPLLPESGMGEPLVVIQRVTPPGVHAFTPAASVTNKSFIAVATRRPDSAFRHIEVYDVVAKKFIEVTRPVSPRSHHYNPFISPDSTRIGYHKCRGSENGRENDQLLLENVMSPIQEVSLFRIYGSYPSFSPTGDRIAFVNLATGLYVMKKDGSRLRHVVNNTAFSTAWDPKREGVVYTGVGPTFASESTEVDIISVNVDDESNLAQKRLTTGGKNNAFPSPSPDGKWVVFRSGRSGYKNLYVMDAVKGEKGGIYRLTEGPWTDTMCNWGPNGDWIAFASDRENPGSGSFEIFMIHPNGTGLKKLVQSGTGGRANHPWFSPDGKHVVFTSDYAGVSAEPISNPHHYQPYGDIFVIGSDGGGIKRLTHNSFEDGTPTWGPSFIKQNDVVRPKDGAECAFEDCHFLSVFPNHRPIGMAPNKIQCGR